MPVNGKIVTSYDVETTGLQRLKHRIFSYAVCSEQGDSTVHRLDGSKLRQVQNQNKLSRMWNADTVTTHCFTMHNAKLDFGFTEQHFKDRSLRKHEFHDTMIMSCLLQNNHPSHALDDLAWELANFPKLQDAAIKPYIAGGNTFDNVPEQLFDPYQIADVERGMLLFLFMYPKIASDAGVLDCYNYERDLIPVTIDMENRGMVIDPGKTKKLIARLQADVKQVLEELRVEAGTGHYVYPGTDEFKDILFKKLKFPIYKLTKTKQPRLNKDDLKQLRIDYPDRKILTLTQKYKSWSRGISTLTGYLQKADDDGSLHPNIRTFAAITGRESCVNPSLMNVEDTSRLLHEYPIPARECFRPRVGYVNFHMDFAGQEMRILIHYSGDPVLVDCANGKGPKEFIRKGEYDVHMPATLIFCPEFWSLPKDVQTKVRDQIKQGNFAKAYGAGWPKLIPTMGIPEHLARPRARMYEQMFPNLCNMMPTTIRQIKNCGYITTAFGRRIYVPKDEAHAGVNFLGQGTGADQIKRAQVNVARILNAETGGEAKLLMAIHDEILIEWPRRLLGEAKPILRKCAKAMVDFGDRFIVPFSVDCEVATYDWQHKVKYDIWNDAA